MYEKQEVRQHVTNICQKASLYNQLRDFQVLAGLAVSAGSVAVWPWNFDASLRAR